MIGQWLLKGAEIGVIAFGALASLLICMGSICAVMCLVAALIGAGKEHD